MIVSSSDEDDDSDSDSRRVLFMALETQEETTENNEGDYEEEGEVNLEEELISALSDLRIARKKNKSLKEELSKLKEGFQNPRKNSEEAKQTIIDLRIQLEEAKVIEETLKRQLEEKKKITENLEAEIVSLRKELQKKDIQLNFGNSTKILDEIICNKKPFYDKSGLGYKQIILMRVQAL
jgi:chromosome segregation ATPase